MDIKSPKVFETSDKAHADLFNDMVKVLLENDSGLLDQFADHTGDTKPHASEAEKKKWNESQIYKITADDGKYLISVPADGSIFDAIKDKGTCTFIASPGVEDSPAPSNAYLRGIQTVGQNNIGTGFAVDTSGNAYYFYYNSSHISITWKQVLTVEDMVKSTFVDTYDQDNSSVSAAENVATKLVFGATRADDLAEYNRIRSEITLKNNGLYLIRLYVTSNNITVGSDNILACYVNGSEYQRFGNWNPTTASSTCVLYLLQKFKAGDKVTFYITPRGTNKKISINTAYVTMSYLR
ncbi:hypothetical protein [Bacillus altitudinis]|uniref:hypothetical protein n=1 Tax=Bacillus altitudinis TaxID=293387 RepID=UPI00064C9A93|nr:hypothetical protein [Bacillus altitudinis]KLV24744.1 hypothetical protein ABW03_03430 [Bacillus altitudinis]